MGAAASSVPLLNQPLDVKTEFSVQPDVLFVETILVPIDPGAKQIGDNIIEYIGV